MADYSFRPNRSLRWAMRRAFWQNRTPLFQRIRIMSSMRDDMIQEEVEYTLSLMLQASGKVRGDMFNESGIFVGNWLTDVFDWVIENWDAILEMVITIISLFAAEQDMDLDVVVEGTDVVVYNRFAKPGNAVIGRLVGAAA